MDKLKFVDKIDAGIIPAKGFDIHMLGGRLGLKTIWEWELFRRGIKIDKWIERNLCTDEGINYALDAAFSGGTVITAWYVLVFEDNHTPAAGNTYATPGFTESTAYDEANRPSWQEAGVVTKQITNSANKAAFTFNATKTIYGGALVGGGTGASTKGDTAGGGTLFCLSQFTSGSKSVVDDDVLQVTVTLTGSDV